MPSGIYKRTDKYKKSLSKARVLGLEKGTVKIWNKGKKGVMPTSWNKGKIGFLSGERHYNWKGGISKIGKTVRQMDRYKQWRSACFQRDNWTCQTCYARGYVTVHHIKAFSKILKEYNVKNTIEAFKCEELWDINNGVTLCEPCHSLTDNYRGKLRKK